MKKWVCPVCGYVHEGDVPPAECPVCHVSGDKFLLQSEEKSWAAEHVVGVGKVFGDDVPEDVRKEIIDGLRANFEGECSEVGMYLAMARVAHREGYPEIGLYWVVKIIFNYNLTAVPSINIHAAPYGTLVCFVIVSSLNLFFVYRTMEDKPNYFKVFAKPLIASLVMAVCARFSYRFFAAHIALGGATTTQIVNVGLAVVLAVIVYVALVLALRIVTRDDLALLPKGEKLARILHVR